MSSVPEVFELDSSQVNEVTVASLNQDVDFIHDSEDSGRFSPEEENKNDFQYEVLSTEQVFRYLQKFELFFYAFFRHDVEHSRCRETRAKSLVFSLAHSYIRVKRY